MEAKSSDRCGHRLSSSKLLGTRAENKHSGFRAVILRYQPLANSFSYIRGQDAAVQTLMQVGCDSTTSSEGRREWRKINSDLMTFSPGF